MPTPTYEPGDVVWLKATTLQDFGYENPREPAVLEESDGDTYGCSLFVPHHHHDDMIREITIDQIEGKVDPDTVRVLRKMQEMCDEEKLKRIHRSVRR